MLDSIVYFFNKSGFVTTLVLVWISLYLVMTLWVFLYKSIVLKIELRREMQSLSNILNGAQDAPEHFMFNKKEMMKPKGILMNCCRLGNIKFLSKARQV